MALIRCQDCDREVSDVALCCPGCGRPIAAVSAPSPPVVNVAITTPKKEGGGCLMGLATLLIIPGLVMVMGSAMSPGPSGPGATLGWTLFAAGIIAAFAARAAK